MHEAGYGALGLPWRYMPFEIDGTELPRALEAMRTLNIRGFGVSMPFKETVLPLLDRVAPEALRIGAVNTVVNDDGVLTGHNTDWLGAVRAFEETRPLSGKRVLVLGAGGAARAVAFGLSERGAAVTLTNRTEGRAQALANLIGATVAPWSERSRLADFDAVVNASSLGMETIDTRSPIPPHALHDGLVVMDIVYKPTETELVREARSRGALCIHGGRMLLHQAAAQFELYTGRHAPLQAMDDALHEQLRRS